MCRQNETLRRTACTTLGIQPPEGNLVSLNTKIYEYVKNYFGKIIQKVSVLTIHFTQFRTKLHRKLPSSTWTHIGLMVNTVPRVQRLGEVIAFPKDQDSIYSHTPKIKPRLCITLQNKTKQKNQNKKTKQKNKKTKQNKTKQNKTKQNKTKQNKTSSAKTTKCG